MSQELLKIENLTKRYDDNTVLQSINMTVRQGEVVVIIGPSGCGKSTFLRCINGLEPIQEGTISFEGELIDRKKQKYSGNSSKNRYGVPKLRAFPPPYRYG